MKQTSSASRLGNLLRAPAVAGFVIFGLGLGAVLVGVQPAQAQLPPVNMGKFVHQPGDNQYSTSTQGERHGGGGGGYQVVNPSAQQVRGPSGWAPVHKNKPDISIEPIVCDEPVPHPGFPPLSDNLELPGIRGGGAFIAGPAGSYAGAGGGGLPPGMAAAPPQSHQGYNTFQPGAFQKGNKTGKGAEIYASGDGAARRSGGGGGGGGGGSNASSQLSRMGREPSLSTKGVADAAPEAPQAVSINQSTTQDLSLPDDQNPNNNKKKNKNRTLQRLGNRIGNRIQSSLYSMPIQMPSMR